MGILFFLESQEAVRAASVLGVATLVTLPFVYLAFLGTALDTPLVRPFRSDRAFAVLALGLVFLVYVLLVSYAVLQAQIFDIHLRIQVVLQRSTVAAAIAGAFFVGSEILESVIPVDDTVLREMAMAAA